MARLMGKKMWREHGALDYKECVGDDLDSKWGIPFPKMMKLKPGEVWCSYIVFKSRPIGSVNAKVMKEMEKWASRKTCPSTSSAWFTVDSTVLVESAGAENEKNIVSNYVSLDGFFADKRRNRLVLWDKETEAYSKELGLDRYDLIRAGDVRTHGRLLPNATRKIDHYRVHEHSPKSFSHGRSKRPTGITPTAPGIQRRGDPKMKNSREGLVIYGSGSIVSTLAQSGLIDDYRSSSIRWSWER